MLAAAGEIRQLRRHTQADNAIASPKVAGYISELLVTDNQIVKAAELLLRIDPRDYQVPRLRQ
jgi:membrane fusion protein (multidrug efflux system)